MLHLSSIFHQFPPFHFNTHHQSLPRVVGPYTKLCCPFRVYFICPPFFSFQYTSHVYDINFPYLQIIYVWLDLVYKVNVHVRSYCFATALTSCQNPEPCPVNPTWPGSWGQVTPSANRINTFLQGYSHQAMSLYYKIRFRIPSDFINGKKKINKLRPINYYTTTSKEKWNRNFLWSFNLKFLIHQWHILILQGFNLCGQTRKNWITFDTNCRYLILHFQG